MTSRNRSSRFIELGARETAYNAFLWALAMKLTEDVIPTHRCGFTFDPRSWRFPSFGPEIWVVSIRGYGKGFKRLPVFGEVFGWVKMCSAHLQRPGIYIGWWLNEEIYEFDLSRAIRSERAAMLFGKEHGQEAIFHPATGRTVFLRRRRAA